MTPQGSKIVGLWYLQCVCAYWFALFRLIYRPAGIFRWALTLKPNLYKLTLFGVTVEESVVLVTLMVNVVGEAV